ncbi:hypothetical protein FF80_03161 [Devosia sp. LC5]|nr:hypothetical protein FF80_03161 [Devosia sp. LC5]
MNQRLPTVAMRLAHGDVFPEPVQTPDYPYV